MRLSGVPLAWIEAAFNRLIAEQPDLIAPVLAGKCVCLKLVGVDLVLFFRFTSGRVILLDEYGQDADATISGTPLALAGAGCGGRADARDLRFDGDLQIAQAFGDLLQGIDPDWEEWLSRYTGDVIAFRIGEAARHFRQWGRQAGQAFAEDLRDYLQIETRQLPVRVEVDQFIHGVDELRADVERFEMRVQRLQRRVDAGKS